MPTAYENLDPYLRPGHPVEYSDTTSTGRVYYYRGPTATLTANKPLVSTTWADSLPVTSIEYNELNAGSSVADLTVRTGVTYSPGVFGSVLEQSFTTLRWRPVALPLEVHPVFRGGGAYDLNVVEGSGASAHNGYQDILGWRAELDPKLRAGGQYKPLDSTGAPASSAITCTANAQKYISYLLRGVEEYVDYMPVWTKRSIYRGSSAPSSGSIGAKGSPSAAGYPSGYEWVKSADNVERVGTSSRWRRDEEWEGCNTVFVDKSSVY